MTVKPKRIPQNPEELYGIFKENFSHTIPWNELNELTKVRYKEFFNTLYEPEHTLPVAGSLVQVELTEQLNQWHLGMTEDIVSLNLGPQLVVKLFKSACIGSGVYKEVILPKDINSLILFTDPFAKTKTLW